MSVKAGKMLIKRGKYRVYKYLLLYLVLFEAGTPVQTVYPKEFILSFFFIAVIMLLCKLRISYKGGKILAFTGISLVLTNVVNLDVYLSTPVMIMMVLFSAIIFSEYYTRSEFEDIYVDLMTFLAAVSVAFWAIGLLFSDFVRLLPVFHGSNGDYPIIMGIFFYPCGSNIYLSTLRRNNGLFREMGLFALLLIWALCIMLQKKNESKYTFKRLSIIIVALITTFSTTGIFAFIMLLPVIIKRRGIKGIWKRIGSLRYVIYMFGIVVFGVIVYQNSSLLFDKLNPAKASYNDNFLARYGGILKDISLFFRYPWGSGATRYSLENIGGANTVSYFLGCFGLITTLVIFFGFFLFMKDLDYQKGSKLFVLGASLLVLMTQGVSEYVVFYMFVVYGYIGYKKDLLEKNEYGAKKNCNDQLLVQRIQYRSYY